VTRAGRHMTGAPARAPTSIIADFVK